MKKDIKVNGQFFYNFFHDWKLLVILFLAFVLALIPLFSQTFFYFDQARDAYEAYSIWHGHHLKILGPATDIPGLFHGVLWYYLLGVLYLLSNNNPQVVTIFLFFALILTIPVVGYITDQLFDNWKVTRISMVLYAFSPLFQLSTRWLSNPVLGLFITPFLILSLWNYCESKTYKWAALAGVCLGILIQSDFAYLLVLLLLPVYVLIFGLYKNIKSLLLFSGVLLLTLSSYFLAELKFKARGILGIVHFLQSPHDSTQSLVSVIEAMLHKIVEFLSFSVFSFPELFVYLIVVSSVVILSFNRRKAVAHKGTSFLLIWLINILLFQLFNTGISRSVFVFYPSLVAVVVLTGYFLDYFIKNRTWLYLTVLILISFQIWSSYSYVVEVRNPLTVQKGMTLPIEQMVIDYTYASSGYKPFTINTVTSPLYINTTWAYLYNFYARGKYKYVPYWGGKDQVGRLGALPNDRSNSQYRYLIIEPTTGIPDFFVDQAILEENNISKLIEEKRIGNFRIQKRLNIQKDQLGKTN